VTNTSAPTPSTTAIGSMTRTTRTSRLCRRAVRTSRAMSDRAEAVQPCVGVSIASAVIGRLMLLATGV